MISAAPLDSYSPQDRAFYSFWYGHMREDLMQPPLADVSHAAARYIWDRALLSAGSQAERLVGAGEKNQQTSVWNESMGVPLTDFYLYKSHHAAPQTNVASPSPLPSPCETDRSELPREPQTDTSGRSHPRYAEACAVVRKQKRASISTVQRHLLIGYNTAAMLLEAMVGDVIAEMPPTTKLLKERA